VEIRRALELNPLSVVINVDLGVALRQSRQYDQAIEQFQKTLELDPSSSTTHANLAVTYIQAGKYDEGIAEANTAVTESHGSPRETVLLGYAYAAAGRKADAQRILDQLNALPKDKYVPAQTVANIYAILGDKDKAFEWLEKGYQDRLLNSIKVSPGLDSLRSDPRFQDLLRRMNLQP
jgi:Flp pilus assembly protein TadD